MTRHEMELTHTWDDLRGRPDELPYEGCEYCGLVRSAATLVGYDESYDAVVWTYNSQLTPCGTEAEDEAEDEDEADDAAFAHACARDTEARVASEVARMEADMERRGLMTPGNDTPEGHAQRLVWVRHCLCEFGKV